MGSFGVHFALTHEEVEKLKSINEDVDRLAYVQELIETVYFDHHPELMAESDKAWDAMHRLLSNGELSYDEGPEPLRFTVIGGEPLYFKTDYVLSLKTPKQVKLVSPVLASISKEEFKSRYDLIDDAKYGFPKSEQDFEYTWEWFVGVVSFFQRAAEEDRYVLFKADQ